MSDKEGRVHIEIWWEVRERLKAYSKRRRKSQYRIASELITRGLDTAEEAERAAYDARHERGSDDV